MPYDHVDTLVELAAGVYVERDTLRVVEAIQQYDPNLRVKYLNPDSGAEFADTPYKIVEVCPDGIERVVFGVWQLDGSVLERLYAADTQKHDILAGIDRNNERVKAEQKRRYKEEVIAEAHDITVHVIKSPRTTYRVPGPGGTVFTFDSHAPTKLTTRTGLEVSQDQVKEG